MPEELYLCIHARELPAQAVMRLREDIRKKPVAVLQGNAPVETVCAANANARRLGVFHGMTRVEAESLRGLALLRRSLAEEQSAKAALQECAERISPRMEDASEDTSCTYVLDLAGSEKLLGAPNAVAMRVRRELFALGIAVSIAVSHNFHVSQAHAKELFGVTVIPKGMERELLAKLPVQVIGPSPAQAETFSLWGIRTVGELAALPEVDLIARLGQDAKRLLELARGERCHTFQPAEMAIELRESYEFDQPVEILESLLFVISPMVQQLTARAGLSALCLANLTIELRLDGGGSYARTVRPALPSLDRNFLLKLVQLDLAAHPPGAGVQAVTVTAEPGPGSKVQLGLFAPQLPESTRLDVTLSRLAALVGEERVGSPILRDTHRPDSFRQSRFSIHPAKGKAQQATPNAALRRIRPPVQLQVQVLALRPVAFTFRELQYQVRTAYGPWRGSGAWWAADVWSQEQWDIVADSRQAETDRSQQLCCVLVCDRFFHQWHMEAIYD